MTKITLSTLKSFIKKNEKKLLIKVLSDFDGMTDCVQEINDNFSKIEKIEGENFLEKNNLGIKFCWIVGKSRDYFSEYKKDNLEGIRVYNCCGSFILAINN